MSNTTLQLRPEPDEQGLTLGVTHSVRSSKAVFAERELLVATLNRAVLDYYSSNDEIRQDAEQWLFEEGMSKEVFSFNWVCDHLGLEGEHLLRCVQKLEPCARTKQGRKWLAKSVARRTSASTKP